MELRMKMKNVDMMMVENMCFNKGTGTLIKMELKNIGFGK